MPDERSAEKAAVSRTRAALHAHVTMHRVCDASELRRILARNLVKDLELDALHEEEEAMVQPLLYLCGISRTTLHAGAYRTVRTMIGEAAEKLMTSSPNAFPSHMQPLIAKLRERVGMEVAPPWA